MDIVQSCCLQSNFAAGIAVYKENGSRQTRLVHFRVPYPTVTGASNYTISTETGKHTTSWSVVMTMILASFRLISFGNGKYTPRFLERFN
jgi:hypothetical protein